MKSFSSKTILIVHFCSRLRSLSSNAAGAYHHFHSNSPLARRDEESRAVRVSVWWDFENCHLPQGAKVFKVAHTITSAVRVSGIKGPVQITAFGDVAQLSRTNQEAMSATGITLTHIPSGGKNSADRSLLVDLLYWVSQNPPPAHLFLISGDRDFATVLHRLRMSNYNILLAGPESTPSVLCSAASIVWQWSSLVKGENITGKYFNQPPDGPYGSWYGHYKVPLENPFEVTEQPPSPRTEEVPESNPDPKPRPVPKVVMKQLRNVLCSHPKGISITELRSELGRCNIDKDLYGYKKFSRFLLSMPQILKLQSGPDGQLFVHSTNPKSPEFSEPTEGVTTGPASVKKESKFVPTQVLSTKGFNAKPSPPSSIEQNVKPYENIESPSSTSTIEVNIKPNEKIKRLPSPGAIEINAQPTEKIEKPSSASAIEINVKPIENIEKVDEAETSKQLLHSAGSFSSKPEVGIFGRTWKQWLYGMDGVTGVETSSAERTAKNVKVDEPNVCSTSQIEGAVETSSKFSSSNGKSVEENISGVNLEEENISGVNLEEENISGVNLEDSNKAAVDVSIFKRLTTWCMFWRATPTIENSSAQFGEKLEQATVKHELFSQESFWKRLEAFLNTPPNSSVLVLHSMSREQMAHNLQKHGPSVLRPLSQIDLLQLVDLLISDKKWIEECSSEAYPFKLVLPPKYSSSHGTSPNKTALRSVFLGTSSPSIAETFTQNCGERANQNLSHTGVSPPATNKKTRGSNKSRNEILSDCQKLVDDIVKENPGGFNMGCFRKRFLDTYGYSLDIQRLGYQKLVTLLQIMPGVKVESSYIYPSCDVASDLEIVPSVEENNLNRVLFESDGELSNPSNKDDELDATWDELGPVAVTGSNKNEFGSQKSGKEVNAKRVNRDYEVLADDYISDSEDDSPMVTQSELPEKPRADQEDSSLLRILDSWYSSKEKDPKEGLESEDDMVNNSEHESRGSSDSVGGNGLVLKTKSPFVHCGLKSRSSRRYSFVSEQNGNNKEKLIDGILGSLKKSSESRVHG